MEPGTGWFPIVPVGLALAGIERDSVDMNSLLTSSRVRDTFRQYAKGVRNGTVTAASGDRVDKMMDLMESRDDPSPNRLRQGLGIHVEPQEGLRSLKLADRLREYSEEGLLVYDTWLVSALA